MGTKQSIPAGAGRTRAYSNSDTPSSAFTSPSGNGRTAAVAVRFPAQGPAQQVTSRPRAAGASGAGASGAGTASTAPSDGNESEHPHGERGVSHEAPRLLIGSLPSRFPPHLFEGFKCPVCSKFVPPDETDFHLVMCLTKPQITYNEDVLTKDADECAICLEELLQGDTIARLPCLCIYHKGCIDEWFEVNRSCPEHPSD
ncbi:E3 ubiquitin-protein ligase znrf2-like [Scleropages formosus]|uniref:RING-type E3 ubiquitin transferase n=1 Tax=Scleropages formosus TaxID=113540 RepID=A0A8C9SUE1_SCLFO|nr:E3 ubiquitin-protein ligase znrf2-like [Scleropages formosus]